MKSKKRKTREPVIENSSQGEACCQQNPAEPSIQAASETHQATGDAIPWLKGKGEMERRIREFDWSSTQIGPIATWSPTLRLVVIQMLANRFPMLLWWGPEFLQIYNDAYRPVLGGSKHPQYLGRPVSECWSEIWHVLRPLIESPFRGGPATWMDDILLEINRYGFVEEAHFTIAYSPVPDETAPGEIGGVMAQVHEITGKIVGDRRVMVLRDLGARSTEGKTAEDACAIVVETLEQYAQDIPFSLLYLIGPDRQSARLAGTSGVAEGTPVSPLVIGLSGGTTDPSPWPLGGVMRSEVVQIITNLDEHFGPAVPRGPWTDPPHSALVVPIRSTRAHYLAGFLVVGVSARLRLDELYQSFFELVAAQVATAIANARNYEEERQKAEALAEIDRAKTAFFSNVSHEFRTPLTLMLGPVEDLLARSNTELSSSAKSQLELVNRNGLRLLRLVNTLLDFSRIEAGRLQAVFEPTDLTVFTAELASVFRAATERAGLSLIVDCPKLPEPVYVDRDMWEKIVLNLVSNAFKFTFEGEIEVKLHAESSSAVLTIRDTGVGIPAEEMPRLFERFHRIQNMRSRTQEGSGIGLALVQELLKFHGGTIRAQSSLGAGTTFIATVPFGNKHLPPECLGARRDLASTATGAAPFIEEALRWLPEAPQHEKTLQPASHHELMPIPGPPGETTDEVNRSRVVIADDNADMRQYLVRLLSERYDVEAVPDGQAALAAARERRPDLVLSDIMMPILDGFGLVRELRADSALKTIPIILLSARAGEESLVGGLQQGADDYLIKPFSARELIARVDVHLEMARMRKESTERIRQSEERFRALMTAGSNAIYRMSPDWSEMRQLRGQNFIADTEEPNRNWLQEYIHPDDQLHVKAVINEAIRTKSVFEMEHRVLRVDGSLGWTFSRAVPLLDASGKIVEWFGAASDITERMHAEEALKTMNEELEERVAQRTAELREKDQMLLLQSRQAAMGEMIGNIAHQWRQPLNTLGLSIQQLKLYYELGEFTEDFLGQSVTTSMDIIQHMSKTIDDFRNFFIPDKEKVEFNVRQVVEGTLSLINDSFKGKNIGLVVIANGDPKIHGFRNEFAQVLLNIFNNASDALTERACIDCKISITFGSENDRTVVAIADNAGGIPEEIISKIFDPYFTTKGPQQGTGIGLYMAKAIIEKNMGGKLTVRNIAEGAEFRIEV